MDNALDDLEIDKNMAQRYLNEGFSGGEKKRNEILQLLMLKPGIAILDEIDSGLDIDALRVVSAGINKVREETGDRKSTRLNSSHVAISYAVYCFKKKKTLETTIYDIGNTN